MKTTVKVDSAIYRIPTNILFSLEVIIECDNYKDICESETLNLKQEGAYVVIHLHIPFI